MEDGKVVDRADQQIGPFPDRQPMTHGHVFMVAKSSERSVDTSNTGVERVGVGNHKIGKDVADLGTAERSLQSSSTKSKPPPLNQPTEYQKRLARIARFGIKS